VTYTASSPAGVLGTFALFSDAWAVANAWVYVTANRGLRAQVVDDSTGRLVSLLFVRPEPPNDSWWRTA